jgi:hypothetical protein
MLRPEELKMKLRICLIFILSVTFFSCKTPEAMAFIMSEINVEKCRWSKAKSYEELKNIALYKYDLPEHLFEQNSWTSANLKSDQIEEDLACTKFLLANLYAGTEVFK